MTSAAALALRPWMSSWAFQCEHEPVLPIGSRSPRYTHTSLFIREVTGGGREKYIYICHLSYAKHRRCHFGWNYSALGILHKNEARKIRGVIVQYRVARRYWWPNLRRAALAARTWFIARLFSFNIPHPRSHVPRSPVDSFLCYVCVFLQSGLAHWISTRECDAQPTVVYLGNRFDESRAQLFPLI
jgi:hypothetical protein